MSNDRLLAKVQFTFWCLTFLIQGRGSAIGVMFVGYGSLRKQRGGCGWTGTPSAGEEHRLDSALHLLLYNGVTIGFLFNSLVSLKHLY